MNIFKNDNQNYFTRIQGNKKSTLDYIASNQILGCSKQIEAQLKTDHIPIMSIILTEELARSND